MEDLDIIIRWVKGRGYLPIIKIANKEVYRGEFRGSSYAALDKAELWIEGNRETVHAKP